MDATSKPICHIVRPSHAYDGKQGLSYFEGIAAETVGAKGICMHLMTIPPGVRAKAACQPQRHPLHRDHRPHRSERAGKRRSASGA
ncbi:hypothetical protein LPU83_3166 [Rhizobium favelukesii]|uniref:Uncharacterized protein n=1 Tax=Rhizobium favelukesii TaxID=348824 RepID=W6RX19_9HYPH|nr:hypothetical protein LPU83_3166 [Rhizobium favelukesii]